MPATQRFAGKRCDSGLSGLMHDVYPAAPNCHRSAMRSTAPYSSPIILVLLHPPSWLMFFWISATSCL